MSQSKMDRVSRPSGARKAEAELMEKIVRHLRKIGGVNTSAIKRISRETGINPRTVKAWYEGRNMPSLLGYIHLSRCYPELIDLFLDQCQSRASKNNSKPEKASRGPVAAEPIKTLSAGRKGATNVGNDVGNNVGNRGSEKDCNARQLWFMLRLQEGATATTEAMADCWRVSMRTAERDITDLRRRGLVTHQGSKRMGRYLLASNS